MKIICVEERPVGLAMDRTAQPAGIGDGRIKHPGEQGIQVQVGSYGSLVQQDR